MKMVQVPMGAVRAVSGSPLFLCSAPICGAPAEPWGLQWLWTSSTEVFWHLNLSISHQDLEEAPHYFLGVHLLWSRQKTACLDRLCFAHGSVFSTQRTDGDLNYCCFLLDVLLVCHKLLLKAHWVSQSVLPPVHANICISAAVSSLPWWQFKHVKYNIQEKEFMSLSELTQNSDGELCLSENCWVAHLHLSSAPGSLFWKVKGAFPWWKQHFSWEDIQTSGWAMPNSCCNFIEDFKT